MAAVPIMVTVAGFFSIALVVTGAVSVGVTGAVPVISSFSVAFIVALAVTFSVAVAIAIAAAGAFAGAVAVTIAVAVAAAGAFPFSNFARDVTALAIAIAFTLFYAYIGWRSLVGDKKYALIRPIIIAFAATGGTSFRGADLTNADFTSATLRSADFRGANLTRTCLHKAKMLSHVRPGRTYLRNAELQQWLIGNGQNKNFDRQDLRGVNLKGANLADASFISANLSEASLQDTDLSRAKLVQAQLDGTYFTGAILTGAYIEDWGITGNTKFKGVRCEYVYMRLPTRDDPDPCRKPDNQEEVFADDDFADFIKPIIRTLDLYHNRGVDPRAIAISLKQLAENNPDAELEIVAMEKRGQDKFLLRAKTAPDADHSTLSGEYFDAYNQFKVLAEQEMQKLIVEKDNRILSLENMIVTALQRSSFYSETHIKKLETMTHNPGGVSQSIGGGQVHGGMQAAQGDHNQLSMKTDVAAPIERHLDKSEVVVLLEKIKQMIQDAELPAGTKEEATSYLSAAKKATEKEQPNKELVKVNLKGMADTLKTTSETVASSKSLWENVKPILMQLPDWLGVAKNFFGF